MTWLPWRQRPPDPDGDAGEARGKLAESAARLAESRAREQQARREVIEPLRRQLYRNNVTALAASLVRATGRRDEHGTASG